MIREPAYPTLLGRVDVLPRKRQLLSNVPRSQKGNEDTHLLFLEHHKVEMPDPLVCIELYSFPKRLLRNDLADILVDQTSSEVPISMTRFLKDSSERTRGYPLPLSIQIPSCPSGQCPRAHIAVV